MSRERIPADVRKLAKELAQGEADAPRLGVRTVHEVWSKRFFRFEQRVPEPLMVALSVKIKT